MGLVYHISGDSRGSSSYKRNNYLQKYKSETPCRKRISRQRRNRVLTAQNVKFLKSLDFKVNPVCGKLHV